MPVIAPLLLLLLLLQLATLPLTHAVLSGNYIPADGFATSPFRGAVQSGGGTGMVLFVDGDEAVVLTVAHGYDLSVKNAQQYMDDKSKNDGGLRLAFGSTSDHVPGGGRGSGGYARSDGSNIIAENLGLWRKFTFGDAETCPLFNKAKHTGKLDDPFGCDGVGPDIDLALQRIRLTPEARARGIPETKLSLDPLTPGQDLLLVGFGRKIPCRWAGMTEAEAQWADGHVGGDALKTGFNKVRANFYSEMFTHGLGTAATDAERVQRYGCTPGATISACAKVNGTLAGVDTDFG